MSDFLNDLGNAAKRVVSGVGTEVSVASMEQKVKDAQKILGQLYYRAVTEGEEPKGPEFDAQVKIIRQLRREIRQKRQSYSAEVE